MADIPQVETVDDALRRASAGLDALKRAKPSTAAEGRLRAAELVRQQQELIDAAHRVADGAAAKRIASTNGHANGHGTGGFTDGQLDVLVEILAHCIGPHLKAIEQRLGELEARPALEDAGIWDRDKVYRPGHVVTHSGSAWFCQEANKGAQPGTCNAWRLAVKRGQDGKDARR